jgi:hypothetical protein
MDDLDIPHFLRRNPPNSGQQQAPNPDVSSGLIAPKAQAHAPAEEESKSRIEIKSVRVNDEIRSGPLWQA